MPHCPDVSTTKVCSCPQSDLQLLLCKAHKPAWFSSPCKPPSSEHHNVQDTDSSQPNTTEWPNSITCPIYLYWGSLAPWLQCKSLVLVNNLFSNSSKGPQLSLDICLAETQWMGVEQREGESGRWKGAEKPEAIYLPNDLWSQFIMDYQHHTELMRSPDTNLTNTLAKVQLGYNV